MCVLVAYAVHAHRGSHAACARQRGSAAAGTCWLLHASIRMAFACVYTRDFYIRHAFIRVAFLSNVFLSQECIPVILYVWRCMGLCVWRLHACTRMALHMVYTYGVTHTRLDAPASSLWCLHRHALLRPPSCLYACLYVCVHVCTCVCMCARTRHKVKCLCQEAAASPMPYSSHPTPYTRHANA
jgi:hypothetical protein